jgi:hypothetical protein
MPNLKHPVIVNPITLPALLTHLLSCSGRTHLIACCTRPHFLQHLYSTIDWRHPFLTPSLDILSTSSDVSIAFCPTVQSLLSYLATFPSPHSTRQNLSDSPSLQSVVLVFPLFAHIDTAANSAQGLSRMFASAVEASIRANTRLIVVEPILSSEYDDTENIELKEPEPVDPWASELPILNITSSKFRVEQRGLVGRTVSIRLVAERWCVFRSLEDLSLDR